MPKRTKYITGNNVGYESSLRYRLSPTSSWFGYLNRHARGPATYVTRDESITTFSGKDGRFRPCVHTTITREKKLTSPVPTIVTLPVSTLQIETNFGYDVVSWNGIYGHFPHLQDLSWTPSNQKWDEMDASALSVMLPSAYNGFSLLNFLLELKDFRRLFSAIMRKKGVVKTLIGLDGNRSWRELLSRSEFKRSVASMHLNYQFALKPLVSDITKLYKTLRGIEGVLQRLKAQQHLPQTRHFRQILVDEESELGWSNMSTPQTSDRADFITYNPSGTIRQRFRYRYRYLERPVYRATMRYKYALPALSDVEYKVKGYLDALGVRMDPSIIWNAIPFSFLVDWVVDVGGFLRSFSTNNIQPTVHIEDFCSSVKFELVSETYRQFGFSSVFNTPELILVERKKSYERRVGIPNLAASLSLSGLTRDQVLLSWSLLNSRR